MATLKPWKKLTLEIFLKKVSKCAHNSFKKRGGESSPPLFKADTPRRPRQYHNITTQLPMQEHGPLSSGLKLPGSIFQLLFSYWSSVEHGYKRRRCLSKLLYNFSVLIQNMINNPVLSHFKDFRSQNVFPSI